jgi:hypothetical protein
MSKSACRQAGISPSSLFSDPRGKNDILAVRKVAHAVRPRAPGAFRVKLLGFLLLLAGWGLVLAALALLPGPAPRVAFVLAGMGVEILGLVLVIRAHLLPRGARD